MRRCLAALLSAVVVLSVGACDSSGEDGPAPDAGSPVAPTHDASMSAPVEPDCDLEDLTYEGFARPLFEARCLQCHSSALDPQARLAAPVGVDFDSEADVAFHQARIAVRAVEQRDMPPGPPLDDCDVARLGRYLESLGGEGACEPSCEGAECGDDGCGGGCGECTGSEYCGQARRCVAADCSPSCEGVACGDDGCGGSCGECGAGLSCGEGGRCQCAPRCDQRSCGEDGCGGTCGSCEASEICGQVGQCLCIPECAPDQQCGADGCGGNCGSCAAGDSCDGAGSCECVPNCPPNRQCGDDGCGGSCGDCVGALQCNTRTGRCVANCTPDCTQRVCGDDGCGGSCGDCSDGLGCTAAGQCTCVPDCVGKACGDDGCGGSCGECAQGLACSGGRCGCSASCDGRACGSDGCGGSCGSCAAGQSCNADGECAAQCEPSCDGIACGDDGCGGSCGGCGGGAQCDAGRCVLPQVGFAEVYGIFQSHGCGAMSCHGGMRPAEGLDLSSQATAEAALLGEPATQCSDGRLLADPGQPAASYLVHKLTGNGLCAGSRMPKSGSGLSAAEIDAVRAWISGL